MFRQKYPLKLLGMSLNTEELRLIKPSIHLSYPHSEPHRKQITATCTDEGVVAMLVPSRAPGARWGDGRELGRRVCG